jgi:hypothetical protein
LAAPFKKTGGFMKKKLFVFAVLILASSAVVFAQDLKFDGYLNSGVGIVANDRDKAGNDPYFKAFGVDSESNGFRFRLNGSYQNEAKNAGVRFRLQGQRTMDISGYLSMPYLYGWVGFFENMITLTGGLVDDATWTSADWWRNDDAGEGLGLLLKAEPVKGLNMGVGAYVISQQSGGNNNRLQVTPNAGGNASLPNFANIMPKPEDVKYTFNVAYTMPDIFRLGAIYRTKNKAGWAAGRDNDGYAYGGQEESMFFQTELRVLAVKNLTAVVVGAFEKLEKFDERGNVILSETFGYKLDDLNVGLNAVQFLYSRQNDDGRIDMNPGLLFNIWGSYAIDKIVPRLDLVYFLGGQSKTASGANQWERRGFVNVAKAKDAEDDYSVFSVRPSVKLNLDNRTFLEIGDMINIDFAVKNGAYDDSGDADKKSLFTNVFYIDVKFSF